MNQRDIAALVRPLSPTAARILLVLFLGNGTSYTGMELANMLGKSQNTISTAIQELEFLGYAQHNGRQYGWSLPSQWRQLEFAENNHGARVPNVPVVNPPALQGGDSAANLSPPVDNSPDPVDNLIQKNLDLGGEIQKNLDFAPSSSLREERRKKKKEENEQPEIQENLEFNDEIRQLLVSAGVGSRSKKLHEILELGLDVEFVRSHIHVWRWYGDEPTSYLITRLIDGDDPPTCGCDDCAPARYHIPEEYLDIIKR